MECVWLELPQRKEDMILILTRPGDEHTAVVTERLKQRGAEFIEFETESFPDKIWASLSFECNKEECVLCINGRKLNFRDVDTVWYRRPMPSEPSPQLNEADREFVSHESMHLVNSLWRLLQNAFWINPFISDLNARFKPYQLAVARQFGFAIPRTLITNNPDEVRLFADTIPGEIAYKSFSNHGRVHEGRGFGIFTTIIDRATLWSHLDQVRFAPCTFQEYIPKRVELRVTVFGRKLFAAEIDSQNQEFSKIDWRRQPPQGQNCYAVPQRRFMLPTKLEQQILSFMNHLGLVFGCLDFIVTPEGEYVFLEINPNGQWYWIEEVTGMPLLECFTQMLMQPQMRHSHGLASIAR
jgi:glutathione synthase/RimK-type ligase-like ATP-grasp enzyme